MSLLYLLNNDTSLSTVGEAVGFCSRTAEIWQLVGKILMVLRIVFPILVIIFGIIDIGKSVTSSKPEEITKSFKSLAFRLGAALAIFFIPTLVGFGIRLANGFSSVDADYEVCAKCLESPNKNCQLPND